MKKAKKINVLATVDMVKALKEVAEPFEIDYTTGGRVLYWKGRSYSFHEKTIPLQEIYFINKVKNQIPEALPDVNKNEIIYTHTEILKRNKFRTFEGYELDLNRAFWQFAKENKFISSEIFEEGLKVGKITRLASLGSCAKKVYKFRFNGKRFILREPTINNPSENVYFKVAHDCSKIMQTLAMEAAENYLFFWCDAIFFLTENTRKNIEAILIGKKLGFKVRKVTIKINKDTTIVYTKKLLATFDPEAGYKKINEKEKKAPRPFFHDNKKSEEYYILNNKNKPK